MLGVWFSVTRPAVLGDVEASCRHRFFSLGTSISAGMAADRNRFNQLKEQAFLNLALSLKNGLSSTDRRDQSLKTRVSI